MDLTSGELLWLYLVRENVQASAGPLGTAARPYLVFASGFLPYVANAQYDLSRWGFANYALRLA